MVTKSEFSNDTGAPVAQWVKRWPTDLADRVRSRSSRSRQNLPNRKPELRCTQSYIINFPSSWYEWNTFEKDVKSQVTHPSNDTLANHVWLRSFYGWYRSHTRFVDKILYDSIVLTNDTGLKRGLSIDDEQWKAEKKTEQAELTITKPIKVRLNIEI